jgi:predicted RNA binding protein YcfA (HicA-like mRNA interferase family)
MPSEFPRFTAEICRQLEERGWEAIHETSGYRWYVHASDGRIVQLDLRLQDIPAGTLREFTTALGGAGRGQ